MLRRLRWRKGPRLREDAALDFVTSTLKLEFLLCVFCNTRSGLALTVFECSSASQVAAGAVWGNMAKVLGSHSHFQETQSC